MNTTTIERTAPSMTVEMLEQTDGNLPAVASPREGVKLPPAPQLPLVVAPECVAKIAAAISNVMSEVGHVAKGGLNEFHRYRYATMENVLQKVTPLLAKHGLAIIQSEIGRSMFDQDRVVAVEYEFTIMHISGEVWPERPKQTGMCRCRDSKGGFDDKSFNKCHTSARKYFLLALFQIPTGDEDDADNEKPVFRKTQNPLRPSRPVADNGAPSDTASLGPADGALDDFTECEAYMLKWRNRLQRAVPTDRVQMISDWNKENGLRNSMLWHDEGTRKTFSELVMSGIAALAQ